MDPEHRPFYVEDRPLPRRPGLMGEINSSVDSIDREPTILAGTVNTFQAKNTQPVSVIYAPRLRRTTYPPVSKTCRNVRLKHGRENDFGSHLDASECHKNKGGTASDPTISLEHKGGASISHWWLILAVCGSFGLAWLGSGFDTSVGEANGGGRAF